MRRLLLGLVLVTALLAACREPEPTAPTATERPPEASATATTRPTATFTPRPTATDMPTATPQPTDTRTPTRTPRPTRTPNPSSTPAPSPTPSPVATLVPVTAAPTAAPQPPFLDHVLLTIARVEQFRNLIPPYCVQNPDGGLTCDGNANCPAVVALYDQIAAPYPPPGSGPTELPAYNLYQSGVASFVETQGGWVSSCREALGTGATVTIGGEQRNTLVLFLQQGLDLLYQAKQLLETGA